MEILWKRFVKRITKGELMKIKAVQNTDSISFYIIDGIEIVRVIYQPFASSLTNDYKISIIRQLYENEHEYDLEPFFKTWIRIKQLRYKKFMSTDYFDFQLKYLKDVLNGGS